MSIKLIFLGLVVLLVGDFAGSWYEKRKKKQ